MSKKRLKIPKGLSEAVYCVKQRPKRKPMIYKTLHRKLKIEQHESREYQGIKSGAPGGCSVAPPLVAFPNIYLALKLGNGERSLHAKNVY